MRIDVLSKEYPPEVYGGAGVHVAELVRALRVLPDVDARVRCFGAPRSEPGTTAYAEPDSLAGANAAIRTSMNVSASRPERSGTPSFIFMRASTTVTPPRNAATVFDRAWP